MKRTGLLLLVLVMLIVGIDGILSLVRQRNIYVSIHATGVITPEPLQPTQQATQATSAAATMAATATIPNGDLRITAAGTLIADVTWDYRVGPVFPKTVVLAEVYDSTGHVISTQQHLIDCANAALQCDGTYSFTLTYGLQDQPNQANPVSPSSLWPPDTYTIQVSRMYEGFAALKLADETFRVIP